MESTSSNSVQMDASWRSVSVAGRAFPPVAATGGAEEGSASARRSTLPVPLSGSRSKTVIRAGIMYGGRRPAKWRRTSGGSGCPAPGRG